ncbi:MAG TPA: hypothetical protein VG034_18675 [Acidimicrobiia bacterium]|jgi:hypothetical protein|nr:hypothetical protein [Acidimicrobiia bacterium]
MNGPVRRKLQLALVAVALLAGGCSRSGASPEVAAVVEGTEIPAAQTEALLEVHLKNELAQAGADGHGVDGERKAIATHFVLLYQIKHALLRHLAKGMNITVESNGDLSPEAEAGRLSQAMAERLFPDVADQQRLTLFSEWFDQQLRTAKVRVDRHFGRWDAGRGVVE